MDEGLIIRINIQNSSDYQTMRYICIAADSNFVVGGKVICENNIFKIEVPEPGRYKILLYGWQRGLNPWLMLERFVDTKPLKFEFVDGIFCPGCGDQMNTEEVRTGECSECGAELNL